MRVKGEEGSRRQIISITNSVNMDLSKHWEIVKEDREA